MLQASWSNATIAALANSTATLTLRLQDGGGLCSASAVQLHFTTGQIYNQPSPTTSTASPASPNDRTVLGLSLQHFLIVTCTAGAFVLLALAAALWYVCVALRRRQAVLRKPHTRAGGADAFNGSFEMGQLDDSIRAHLRLHRRDASVSVQGVYAELFSKPIGSFVIHSSATSHQLFLKATQTECRQYAIKQDKKKNRFSLVTDDLVEQPKFASLEDLAHFYTTPRPSLPVALMPSVEETEFHANPAFGVSQVQASPTQQSTSPSTQETQETAFSDSSTPTPGSAHTSGKGRAASAYDIAKVSADLQENDAEMGQLLDGSQGVAMATASELKAGGWAEVQVMEGSGSEGWNSDVQQLSQQQQQEGDALSCENSDEATQTPVSSNGETDSWARAMELDDKQPRSRRMTSQSLTSTSHKQSTRPHAWNENSSDSGGYLDVAGNDGAILVLSDAADRSQMSTTDDTDEHSRHSTSVDVDGTTLVVLPRDPSGRSTVSLPAYDPFDLTRARDSPRRTPASSVMPSLNGSLSLHNTSEDVDA